LDHDFPARVATSSGPPSALSILARGDRQEHHRVNDSGEHAMKLILALTAAALLTAPTLAAPACRDAKGKFIKCTTTTAAGAGVTKGKDGKCRDAKGHFAKCPK
jgi:hypothetical protein